QRGVGIWVLQATAMPSVLIETGFITNPEEEAYLNSNEGQSEISRCIISALKNYTAWLEKKQEENLKDEKDNDKEQEKEKDKDPKKGFQAGVKNFLEMVDHNEKMQRRGR
ncbi:MAG TPA: N-acetylmuramoyl-L-alanine amidase, partial [Chitinophagaceae bacterium]|nr:N-acetylmuramoyl-L-alanine amidase [Chitinophagaceae bacterium]